MTDLSESYERLEFLGDAVLDMRKCLLFYPSPLHTFKLIVCAVVVVQSFFADEEKWSPHSMTMIKVSTPDLLPSQVLLTSRLQSSMVSNRVLAIICIESGLYRFLLHNTPHLSQSIKSFVEELEACKRDAQNDLQRLKYWSNLQAPKVCSDCGII